MRVVVAHDVAVLEAGIGDRLVESLKTDAHAFRVAVLLVEPAEPSVPRALRALERGVQDVLVEPVRDAELLLRVTAAGRTKVLQEEMVAQAERLEAMILEDPLTGLANRRFILTALDSMISGARRHDRALALAIVDVDPCSPGIRPDRARGVRRPLRPRRGRSRARHGRALAAVAPARGGPARPARRRGAPAAGRRRALRRQGRGP